jgi:hypothetical protein
MQDEMMPRQEYIPPRPPKSFRIKLEVHMSGFRLDNVLLKSLREQKQNLNLQNVTRTTYKELFSTGKILIKGQRARPSSNVCKGITYVDILGY